MPKKYGMVIDLHQCVGCGACALACKNENNTRTRDEGQSYNWADFLMKTEGSFPNVKSTTIPVLCNHCTNAFCVEACPVTPKAMFKADDNTTLHNQGRCIGCRLCQEACPYSQFELAEGSFKGESYSVISFNFHGRETQPMWSDGKELIPGCTASGAESAQKAGATPPAMNQYESGDYQPVRRSGVVEKCIFCHHRITHGLLPACVEACPAQARLFGDLNDPASAPALTLKKHQASVLLEEEGTEPNVFYVREYGVKG
ncbi:4Fe-4S ferredoxin [Desulfuromonas versatilis]|uniref:4Fe-4S ferredoxin n=1 Tax=Desulfuromonas versatilis TaxID=2802975 RepID=A0ABN6DUB5_9BACT|nr:4Fe-4S dicluster domain-containing protein [Desulfuromonas versatilis]BCR03703.1 4Fe-4S ferredoxin [Desulfuromonas versatilis]